MKWKNKENGHFMKIFLLILNGQLELQLYDSDISKTEGQVRAYADKRTDRQTDRHAFVFVSGSST